MDNQRGAIEPDAEAAKVRMEDPDHATRDLYETIADGGEAAWKFYIQVCTSLRLDKCHAYTR